MIVVMKLISIMTNEMVAGYNTTNEKQFTM